MKPIGLKINFKECQQCIQGCDDFYNYYHYPEKCRQRQKERKKGVIQK